MKKIWHFLRHHIAEDFNLGYYGVIVAFLITSITLNYIFDFEDTYLETLTGLPKFIAYLIFYSTAYFFSLFSFIVLRNRKNILYQKAFWVKSIFSIAVLSFDSSAPFLDALISSLFEPQVQFWAYKVGINSISFLTVFIPILIFYYLFDKDKKNIYGLNSKRFDTTPYFTMLLIMLPLIIAASFNGRFLIQYPMYKSSAAHLILRVPEWVTIATYEVAYGLDFVTVEFLFRGFMVIGMMSLLGRSAVLSMTVVYCFLHFGKPAGEAISSIFGGFILGVIAFETKSIWGGIIVHMGIAWMMELVAFIQKSFSQ